MSGRRWPQWALALPAALAVLGVPRGAAAAEAPAFDGPVYAAAASNGTLYVGGQFTRVYGPAARAGALVDRQGIALPVQPRFEGSITIYNPDPFVNTAVPDGAGGWFVGGSFARVNGLERPAIAHLLADGSVTSLVANPDGMIYGLAAGGGRLYAWGSFTHIGGQARNGLAGLDVATGEATAWDPNANSPQPILPSAVLPLGDKVFLCGYFNAVGGETRNYLAAVDTDTGALLPWNPNPDNFLNDMVQQGGKLIVAGYFSSVGGAPRPSIAQIDTSTGAATSWDAHSDGYVNRMAVSGSTLYVAGSFQHIGGASRTVLAALDLSSGQATSWKTSVPDVPYTMAAGNGALYLGGYFGLWAQQPIEGTLREFAAAVDLQSGAVTPWDPGPGNQVNAIAPGTDAVFLAGGFEHINDRRRRGLAAIDIATGALADWHPEANGLVQAITVSGSTVYVGGRFTTVAGEPRNRLAALDASSGVLRPWDPDAGLSYTSLVYALATSGAIVYAGGVFDQAGGEPRRNLAAIDSATGSATDWDPQPDGIVRALAVTGKTVYAGGYFSNIAGAPRSYLAALDAVSGAATAWTPDPDAQVYALATSRGRVYAGGEFTAIAGRTRRRLCALDATTGAVSSWNPAPDDAVYALATSWGTVYAGGLFETVGGQARSHAAAIDATTGLAHEWSAAASDWVRAVAAGGGRVFVGGGTFVRPTPYFAEGTQVDTPAATWVASEPGSDRVRLTWHVTSGLSWPFTVSRRVSGSDWVDLGERTANAAGDLIFEDSGLAPEGRYEYRLAASQPGEALTFGETQVTLLASPQLSLGGLWPNPAVSDLHVAFTLATSGAARLELLDLSGRRVISREVGSLGPGPHQLALAPEQRLPAGLYLLRLSQDGASHTTKVAVLQRP